MDDPNIMSFMLSSKDEFTEILDRKMDTYTKCIDENNYDLCTLSHLFGNKKISLPLSRPFKCVHFYHSG